jgi:isoleucyl-tRNA synthetase
MFQPVTAKPDFVAQEHDLLREWAERRTFARLRAQNEGGPRWSFLDGPITANNPMGVHHAWGRAYKDLFQRYHAMLGEDQRYQNGFDCQACGSRSTWSGTSASPRSATSRRTASTAS